MEGLWIIFLHYRPLRMRFQNEGMEYKIMAVSYSRTYLRHGPETCRVIFNAPKFPFEVLIHSDEEGSRLRYTDRDGKIRFVDIEVFDIEGKEVKIHPGS